jgi:hypothetical protein
MNKALFKEFCAVHELHVAIEIFTPETFRGWLECLASAAKILDSLYGKSGQWTVSHGDYTNSDNLASMGAVSNIRSRKGSGAIECIGMEARSLMGGYSNERSLHVHASWRSAKSARMRFQNGLLLDASYAPSLWQRRQPSSIVILYPLHKYTYIDPLSVLNQVAHSGQARCIVLEIDAGPSFVCGSWRLPNANHFAMSVPMVTRVLRRLRQPYVDVWRECMGMWGWYVDREYSNEYIEALAASNTLSVVGGAERCELGALRTVGNGCAWSCASSVYSSVIDGNGQPLTYESIERIQVMEAAIISNLRRRQ